MKLFFYNFIGLTMAMNLREDAQDVILFTTSPVHTTQDPTPEVTSLLSPRPENEQVLFFSFYQKDII